MRIVSRLNQEDEQLERLKSILEAVTDGDVSDYGETKPGDTLEELVTQVDLAFVDYMEQVDDLEEACDELESENMALAVQCAVQEKTIEDVSSGVPFDEALDHATLDLMDALLGSGSANTTYDGGIAFEEGIVFTREDLKPLLRQAIDTWITMKVR